MPRQTEKKPSRKNLFTIINEWQSIRFSQKPRRMMLLAICVLNIALVLISAWVISSVALPNNERMGFFTAVYNTLTMMMDAGCIQSIISNPGSANTFLMIFCLVVIIISMITFTGALIGYVTNIISSLIDNANTNSQQLMISNHVVILGWNSRASEMVNDLLYCPRRQRVVILTDDNEEDIKQELQERLNDTIKQENQALRSEIRSLPLLRRFLAMQRGKLRQTVTYIVRKGDIFSSIHLNNIQLERAKSVIILSSDSSEIEKANHQETMTAQGKSDSRTVKTLMQVIDITSKSTSNDDQKIVVEVNNEWTGDLVEKIIRNKQELKKCRVVPFRVHRAMGQLLCQFSLMPELNRAYQTLFSNKGAAFYALPTEGTDEFEDYADSFLNAHRHAIPLAFIRDDTEGQNYCYYIADTEKAIGITNSHPVPLCPIRLNKNYWLSEKSVLILGSNSKAINVMNSFKAFCGEWTNADHPHILHITVVDEEEKLRKADFYRQFPFVEQCIGAEIQEQGKILGAITAFIRQHPENASILILSDDTATDNDIDAKALTYLIDVKDVINQERQRRENEHVNIDVVVEIIDPKHFDVVRSYDVNNVVISNRYISKMITQISENFPLYNLYIDMMSYDSEGVIGFDSKEVYIKRARDYFSELPPENIAASTLIRSVYAASRRFWGYEKDFAILIGYVDTAGGMHLFSGDQDQQTVTLTADDNLIIFSNH